MKVASAQPAVTEGFCVGDSKQGTIPIQVGRQNEKQDGPEEPHVPAAVVPDLIFRLIVHKL